MFTFILNIIDSLNPCCNGIYLIMSQDTQIKSSSYSLNPCCNGIYLIIVCNENLKTERKS